MLSDKDILERMKESIMNKDTGEIAGLSISPYYPQKLGSVSYDLTTRVEYQNRGVKRLVTEETINIPRDLVGIVCSRSRLAMRGLFASFSSLVDPGYRGKLTFLVWCPEEPNKNYDESDLFQIMFFKVGEVNVTYNEKPNATAMDRPGFSPTTGSPPITDVKGEKNPNV
jgi:dUTPase